MISSTLAGSMNIEINEDDEYKNEYWQIEKFWEFFQKLLNGAKYPQILETFFHQIFLNPVFYDSKNFEQKEIEYGVLANFYRKLVERKEKIRPNNFVVEYRYYFSGTHEYSNLLNNYKLFI